MGEEKISRWYGLLAYIWIMLELINMGLKIIMINML